MKIIALLLISLTLSNCKSIEIGTIQKQLVTPGVPSGVFMLRYNTTLTASEKFTIKSLSLKNLDYNNLNIVITDLSNGLLLSKDSVIEKGSYYIETSIPFDPVLEKTIEIFELNIQTEHGTNLILEGKSVLAKPLRMK